MLMLHGCQPACTWLSVPCAHDDPCSCAIGTAVDRMKEAQTPAGKHSCKIDNFISRSLSSMVTSAGWTEICRLVGPLVGSW